MDILRVLFIIITTVLFSFAVRSIVKAATNGSGAHRVAGLVAIPAGAAISILLSTLIFA